MDHLPLSVCFVLGCMGIGLWLERINGKHGIIDELFTPIPMGLAGVIVLIERAWA